MPELVHPAQAILLEHGTNRADQHRRNDQRRPEPWLMGEGGHASSRSVSRRQTVSTPSGPVIVPASVNG